MERFAISILHKQIYKICRLCGVDNPVKYPIIDETETIIVGDDDEATLAKKIEECVGIQVSKDDRMPQNICSLCVDKISDFYEYRLMCASTNVQTRTILNLPLVEPSRKLLALGTKDEPRDVKEDVKVEVASSSSGRRGRKRKESPSPSPSPAPTTRIGKDFVKDEPVPSTPVKALTKKERLRQLQLQQEREQQELEQSKQTRSKYPSKEAVVSLVRLDKQTAKPELLGAVPPPKKIKYEHPCSYCTDEFKTQTELDQHLAIKHIPNVRKFGCGSCRETFETVLEFKDHNLWHQLTRTPFTCFRCKRKHDKNLALVKHVATNSCGRLARQRPPVVLPDVQCRFCSKKFRTQNLYEWHACFLKPKTKCPKCDKYFVKKQILTRHYIMFCTGTLPPPEPLLVPKLEPLDCAPGISAAIATTSGMGVGSRSRRAAVVEPELPKEEREIPFPPPLELEPEASSSSRKRGRPKGPAQETTADPAVQTEKIASLLDSGAKLDGDTDIATINNLLSSVSEAIASISEAKAKKKKKKKDKNKDRVRSITEESSSSCSPVDTRTEEERQADALAQEVGEMSLPEQLAFCSGRLPMLVLPRTVVKQEITEIDTEPSQLQEPLENGEDDDEHMGQSGADFSSFQDDDDDDEDEQHHEPPPQQPGEIPFPMPIKQEAMAEKTPDQEPIFNAQLALNIKREPGLVEEDYGQPQAAKRKRPGLSPNPLILKIRKDRVAAPEKSKKTIYKKPNILAVRIKQEKSDPGYDRQELLAAQLAELPGGVCIKQERIDPQEAEIVAPKKPRLPRPVSPVVAFDGVRIKQEKVDDVVPEREKSTKQQEPVPAAPADKSSQAKDKKQKKDKGKINPFALLKQRMAAEVAARSATPDQQSASPLPVITNVVGNAPASTASSSSRSSISSESGENSGEKVPVIAQVQSIAGGKQRKAVAETPTEEGSNSGDGFPQPIKEEPTEDEPEPTHQESNEANNEAATEEKSEFPMPIKEEAPDEPPAPASPEETEQSEFPMPIKEEPEESQNGQPEAEVTQVSVEKEDRHIADDPENSTSPISDTPMDEYDQNSQQSEPAVPLASSSKDTQQEPPKESEFEELQNLLTEGLRPPDDSGGDEDLDSLLNNKLEEIQQPPNDGINLLHETSSSDVGGTALAATVVPSNNSDSLLEVGGEEQRS